MNVVTIALGDLVDLWREDTGQNEDIGALTRRVLDEFPEIDERVVTFGPNSLRAKLLRRRRATSVFSAAATFGFTNWIRRRERNERRAFSRDAPQDVIFGRPRRRPGRLVNGSEQVLAEG